MHLTLLLYRLGPLILPRFGIATSQAMLLQARLARSRNLANVEHPARRVFHQLSTPRWRRNLTTRETPRLPLAQERLTASPNSKRHQSSIAPLPAYYKTTCDAGFDPR
ncbi:hypothetical protein LIA77_05489 [Sarocladium implicatum]|nr:hypothetical protein LIA77_05489 [Sarocladium implicatum]